MITPPYLHKGDKVAIVAPAKRIEQERIENAVKILTDWGLKVIVGKNLISSNNYFSGSDIERIEDIQEAIDNIEIKAIICARGGYGSIRIIDSLNFNSLRNNPKWIVGFSDITVFHNHLNKNLDLETIHGLMPLNYPYFEVNSTNESLHKLRCTLFGNMLNYQIPHSSFNQKGFAIGELVGGNLSMICSLIGSSSEIDTKDKILFIEEVDESLYKIDRLLYQLKRSGKLRHLKGLIVGSFTSINNMDKNYKFNKSIEDIIIEITSPYRFPICFGFPAGHSEINFPLIMGREINLNITDDGTFIDFAEKETIHNQNNKAIKNAILNGAYIVIGIVLLYIFYSLVIHYLI